MTVVPVKRVNVGAALCLSVIFLAALSWTSWIMALLKAFNAWAGLSVSVIATLIIWKLCRVSSAETLAFEGRKERIILYLVLAVIIVSSVLNFFLFHDCLNGYQDEGIYSNDAIYLSNRGELPFPNFRGLDTRLFLNTAWNAELYGLLGYDGLRLCNVFPLAVALLCIFLLVLDISREPLAGLFAVCLLSFSYPMLWFTRRTVNEIYFLSLFWTAIYFFYRSMKGTLTLRTDLTIFMLLAPLMAFIRLEGLIVLSLSIVGAVFVYLRSRKRGRTYSVVAFCVLLVVMLVSLWGGYSVLNAKYSIGGKIGNANEQQEIDNTSNKRADNVIINHKPAYTTMVMMVFGIIPALIFIPILLILLLGDRVNRSFAVFIFLLLIPFLYYYLEPTIYFDLPWFLRRFITVIIPLSYISFSAVIFRLNRVSALLIATVYLFLTVYISAPVIFHHDYKGVVRKVDMLAKNIPGDGKVLVDRYALDDYVLTTTIALVHDRDAIEVTPWQTIPYDSIGENDTVYLVTNLANFGARYKEGAALFGSAVRIKRKEIIEEMDIRTGFLVPICQFHRQGNTDFWTRMDYRIALSNVRVPSEKVYREYRAIVVRMELEKGGRE